MEFKNLYRRDQVDEGKQSIFQLFTVSVSKHEKTLIFIQIKSVDVDVLRRGKARAFCSCPNVHVRIITHGYRLRFDSTRVPRRTIAEVEEIVALYEIGRCCNL